MIIVKSTNLKRKTIMVNNLRFFNETLLNSTRFQLFNYICKNF